MVDLHRPSHHTECRLVFHRGSKLLPSDGSPSGCLRHHIQCSVRDELGTDSVVSLLLWYLLPADGAVGCTHLR